MRLLQTHSTLNPNSYQTTDREFAAMGVEYFCIGLRNRGSESAWSHKQITQKPINNIASYQNDCLHQQNFEEPQLTRTNRGYRLIKTVPR